MRRSWAAVTAVILASCAIGSEDTGTTTTSAPPSTTVATTAPSTTTTPTTAPTTTTAPAAEYAVVLVTDDDVLNVRDQPLGEIVATLNPTADGIRATGSTAEQDGEVWMEIEIGSDAGWVNSRYLTAKAPGFANDSEPLNVLDQLAAIAGGSGGDWSNVVGPKGLTVVHFDPPKWWPPNTNPFADPTVYQWGGEAAGPAAFSDTFANEVGTSLDGVLNDPDLQIGVDMPKQGPEAAPPFIPTAFQNFHYLAAFDPEDDSSYDGLDWTTWYVFFDWTPQGWRIVGLSIDSWAP